MDGAIESGKRAADEVSRRLKEEGNCKMELEVQEDVLPYTKVNRPTGVGWMSKFFEWW
jgi:ADP-ribose pyrophosphatase YjhB (NUDIX family)